MYSRHQGRRPRCVRGPSSPNPIVQHWLQFERRCLATRNDNSRPLKSSRNGPPCLLSYHARRHRLARKPFPARTRRDCYESRSVLEKDRLTTSWIRRIPHGERCHRRLPCRQTQRRARSVGLTSGRRDCTRRARDGSKAHGRGKVSVSPP